MKNTYIKIKKLISERPRPPCPLLPPPLLDTNPVAISSSLQRFVSKGQLSQAASTDALRRLRCTSNLEELGSADFIIEAIIESEELVVLKQVDEFCFDSKPTIGVEFQTRTVIIKIKVIKAQIWDTTEY